MNAVFAIKPYRWSGQWVFDDEAHGLDREPFVGGADTMIDVTTESIPDAQDGFLMIFSAKKFPGAEIILNWRRKEGTGNVYFWDEKDMEGWLCPALLAFFRKAPKKLYVQVKAAG